ncbi:MAG: OsmC family protein, partial [Alphaproteobacteria bacterium]
INLTHASVKLFHEKIHAKDCDDCETQKGKIDVITRELTIEGDMDDATRQRMLEIADMCPVHRTLENEVKVKTSLTD